MFQCYSLKNLLFALLLIFCCTDIKGETDEQRIKVTLRTIGHEFLLALEDSTSRVLPVEELAGRYAVKFERKFSFEPDALFAAVFKVLESSKSEDSYLVEVEQCDTTVVIHSFVADLAKDKDLIACKLRKVPPDCYVFYFTITKGETAVIAKRDQTSTGWLLFSLFTLSGGLVLLYFLAKKSRRNSEKDLLSIGQFQFDQKGMKLNLKAQTIELSSKETDLLYLLYSNENQTLERDHILNMIWGDEGDYVGRTLDVFISKLRKKLQADSNVKIINVRGVGYRLVIH